MYNDGLGLSKAERAKHKIIPMQPKQVLADLLVLNRYTPQDFVGYNSRSNGQHTHPTFEKRGPLFCLAGISSTHVIIMQRSF